MDVGVEWGDATVSYPDWKGTFQIDEKMTGPTSIYDLTTINRDEWMIIGFDWGGGELLDHKGQIRRNPHWASVIVA
ncbi:hypothetical protein [Microlunatus speluncae]|uniref:hypothetical protein n=1 Tax=Microlunatus speluncae TaxID=2594267 RepID=UPI001266677C|nr:hypothetical protein [Microlunatus speluncae]